MAITYTYHVTNLPTTSSPETDTVEYVEAYLHGIDENGKNTTQIFTFKPEIPESYSENFIKYEDLTEEQIISWIGTQVPEERRKEIEAEVAKKIAKFYEPTGIGSETTYKSPVPW
mgnify:FL=1|tara:strand:+ start:256 stop:600 length:345 start_codon:yes stop_codon:yes gene_type:complete